MDRSIHHYLILGDVPETNRAMAFACFEAFGRQRDLAVLKAGETFSDTLWNRDRGACERAVLLHGCFTSHAIGDGTSLVRFAQAGGWVLATTTSPCDEKALDVLAALEEHGGVQQVCITTPGAAYRPPELIPLHRSDALLTDAITSKRPRAIVICARQVIAEMAAAVMRPGHDVERNTDLAILQSAVNLADRLLDQSKSTSDSSVAPHRAPAPRGALELPQ